MQIEKNGKAVLYARVSTQDGSQHTENQVDILRDQAQRLGLKIVKEYVDHATGGTGDRDEFKKMFTELPKTGAGTTLLFWTMDRLTREGIFKTFDYLQKIDKMGIVWKSYSEPYLDTDSPIRDLVIALLAWVAQQEKRRIGERTRAGLARVKKEGTKSGKPIGRPVVEVDLDFARELITKGTERAAAKEMGIPLSTLRTKLYGRSQKKPAAIWSEPVHGTLDEGGIFSEDPRGQVVIRYDRMTGKPHCLNHQVELNDCRNKHLQEVSC